jgi:hypothetical protein
MTERVSALVDGSLETVEDQVEPDSKSSRPHDLGDDLDDVGVLVGGESAEDVGRHLLGVLDLERQG